MLANSTQVRSVVFLSVHFSDQMSTCLDIPPLYRPMHLRWMSPEVPRVIFPIEVHTLWSHFLSKGIALCDLATNRWRQRQLYLLLWRDCVLVLENVCAISLALWPRWIWHSSCHNRTFRKNYINSSSSIDDASAYAFWRVSTSSESIFKTTINSVWKQFRGTIWFGGMCEREDWAQRFKSLASIEIS